MIQTFPVRIFYFLRGKYEIPITGKICYQRLSNPKKIVQINRWEHLLFIMRKTGGGQGYVTRECFKMVERAAQGLSTLILMP